MLKTSVVIPTKNSVGTIDQCLSSLMPYFEQGYIGEIVVVDAHSTDGTLEVLKRYPVKLFFDEGRGFNVACEIGWRNATGDLIIFFDSDAYLEQNFFPDVYKFFSDEWIGIIGCQPKAVVTNRLTKAIAEEWEWGTQMVNPKRSHFQRLYCWLAGNSAQALPGGPCQVVRRTCLEEVNGFSMSDVKGGEDVYLSKRIVQKGWKSAWWVDAPLYHYPRTTLRALAKEYHRFGQEATYREMKERLANKCQWHHKFTNVIVRLGSPAIGVYLAIRFRNPAHLITYPLPRYAWAIGYISGWLSARKLKAQQPA